MTAYYNSAALSGGLSIKDAFDALNGGWNFSDAGQWQGYQFYNPSDTDTNAIAGILAEIKKRYDVPANRDNDISNIIRAIFTYDTYLMNGQPQLAHRLKTAYLAATDQPVAMRKIWSYLRTKMHRGTSRHEKMTKAIRDARKAQLLRKRAAAMRTLRARDWVGSAPYIGQGMKGSTVYSSLATPWGSPNFSGQAYAPFMVSKRVRNANPVVIAPPAAIPAAIPPAALAGSNAANPIILQDEPGDSEAQPIVIG